MQKKGQVAFEYLVLIGVLLVILTPIFYYSGKASSSSIAVTQGRETVQEIANVADSLYKLGGGKTTIIVDFPNYAESITVVDNTIIMRLVFNDRAVDLTAQTVGDVVITIASYQPGKRILKAEVLSDGSIAVSD